MKRYVKTYKSKWQNQYTEEFKQSVCKDFLSGNMTLRAVEHKYGLGNSRLNDWLKKYGYKIKKPYIIETRDMAKKGYPKKIPFCPGGFMAHDAPTRLCSVF